MKSINKRVEIPCNFCPHIIKVIKTNLEYALTHHKYYYASCKKCGNKNKIIRNENAPE